MSAAWPRMFSTWSKVEDMVGGGGGRKGGLYRIGSRSCGWPA